MSRILSFLVAIALGTTAGAQDIYYPPTAGNTWATTDPASLGWCTDELPALLDFMEGSNSKAFIVLKDGRIVIEEYFGTFTADSSWYWASAGKSLNKATWTSTSPAAPTSVRAGPVARPNRKPPSPSGTN
jgi:hypothetical protein